MAGGSPEKQKGLYLFTRLRCKIARIVSEYFGPHFSLFERTQARAYDEMLREAKKIRADWYIGHNMGALPVAVKAAMFHGAKAGFDFEDYYRGENLPGMSRPLERISYLENKYLPSLSYYSVSSDLIGEAVHKDHPGFNGIALPLLNCFPSKQQPRFVEKNAGDSTLQLFWFSQTIGTNRGLELLMEAMKLMNDSTIHLTLAGRCDKDMLTYILAHAGSMNSNIHFAGIIQPEELPAFAAHFDVGMAMELAIPINRDLCLTNKIFTYLLAGNAIILSETAMQLTFNKTYKVGQSFANNDVEALCEKIRTYKDTPLLRTQRLHNYCLAKETLNWEVESKKLLATIH